MDQERRGEDVAQETQPRNDRREPVWLRQDVEKFDLQNVAGPGALDEDRTREGMDGPGLHACHVGLRR